MTISARELQQIRGIGDALSARLLAEGHDSFAKVAALGSDGLKKLPGINVKAIPAILEQAAELAARSSSEHEARIKALKDSMEELRNTVQVLTVSARDRFAEKLAGKPGRKLTEDLVQFMAALEKLEAGAGKRVKRTGRCILKAELKLEGLAGAGLKKLRQGLKKSRKALQKAQR